jgi:3-dehydroquinate dehydratase-1
MIRYCLPIIAKSKNEIIVAIEANTTQYDYFEVWIDYICDFDIIFFQQLLSQYDNKLIIVTRRQNLESIRCSINTRYEIIALTSESKALLDLDLNHQIDELHYISNTSIHSRRLLLSYHDYTSTPSYDELTKIIKRMDAFDPAIYKIATHCNTKQDPLHLLETLLELQKQNKKAIIVGMGQIGRITRIYGALWGNVFNFAPLKNDQASAPGQFTRIQYEQITKELGI